MAPRTRRQDTATEAAPAVPATDTSVPSASSKGKKKKRAHRTESTLPRLSIKLPRGSVASVPGKFLAKVEVVQGLIVSDSPQGSTPCRQKRAQPTTANKIMYHQSTTKAQRSSESKVSLIAINDPKTVPLTSENPRVHSNLSSSSCVDR
jgi:hypothetical protein